MFVRWLIIGVMLWTCVCPLEAAGKATGVIPARVEVRGREIKVLEIARVSGASTELRAQMEGASLGPAPDPGQSLTLPRSTVFTRLRANIPSMDKVAWQVAEKVTVHRLATEIGRTRVDEAFRRFVEEHVAVPVDGLTIEALQVRTPIRVPQGDVFMDFEARDGDDLLGPTSLTLNIRVDGEAVARVPVRARVEGEAHVLVTTRAIARGELLSDGDLAEQIRSVSRFRRQLARDRAQVVGKVAKRSLSANRVVQLSDFEEKAIFKRGDSVMMVVLSSGMVVSCPGEALEDGHVGEMLSIRNSMSEKVVRGRVQADGTVRVDYRPPPKVYVNGAPVSR